MIGAVFTGGDKKSVAGIARNRGVDAENVVTAVVYLVLVGCTRTGRQGDAVRVEDNIASTGRKGTVGVNV